MGLNLSSLEHWRQLCPGSGNQTVLVMTPRPAEQEAPAEAAAPPRPLPFDGTSVLAPRRISSVSIPGRMLSPQAAAHLETLFCCPGLLANPYARLLVLSLGRPDGVPLATLAAFGHRPTKSHRCQEHDSRAQPVQAASSFRTPDAPQVMRAECVVPFPPAWSPSWCLPASRS